MDFESSNPKKSDRSTGKRDHVVYIDDLKTKSDASTSKSDSDEVDDVSIAYGLCLVFLVFFVSMGVVIGPKLFADICVNCPRISITSVEISSLTSASATATAADIMVSFVSDNSRHGGDEIKFGDILASVYYEGSLIASNSVYPFDQDPMEVTERKARMRASNMDWISNANNNKTHHDGVLSFDITISSPSVLLRMHTVDLKAFCDGVRVKFTNMSMAGTGFMIGGSKDCRLVAKEPKNH